MRHLTILIILLLTLSCGEKKVEPQIAENIPAKELPDQESWDSKIIISEDGITRAIVYAKHLEVFESKAITLLEGVKINFFDKEGHKTSTLTSRKGKVNDKTKDMFAIDSVVAVSDSGMVLKTEELVWKNKIRKIMTDKFVTIDDKDEHIEGYGFEADDDLSNYTIFKVTYKTRAK